MSKERAQRRAVREAEEALRKAKRARQVARRARWRPMRRALAPRTLYRRIVPDRRTGRLLPRRNSGERLVITTMTVVALAAVWLLLDSWPVRIGLTVLAIVAVPVLVVVAFDRRTR
ncbi:hypothetical protein [Luedemannella helvata]|uniref:Uncharacterized protein n=1 Tax=Luedemannella helvata TaxID=349315 RepID=A0ABP4VZX5_9ACTN